MQIKLDKLVGCASQTGEHLSVGSLRAPGRYPVCAFYTSSSPPPPSPSGFSGFICTHLVCRAGLVEGFMPSCDAGTSHPGLCITPIVPHSGFISSLTSFDHIACCIYVVILLTCLTCVSSVQAGFF